MEREALRNQISNDPTSGMKNGGRRFRPGVGSLSFTIAVLLLAGNACSLVQTVKDPLERIVREGSCISVDIPPITLTPRRTAAERQLIGEESDIEKDGWLIASSRSSGLYTGSDGTDSSPLTVASETERRYYIEQGVLEFYADPIETYRARGILGESHGGILKLVPAAVAGREDSARMRDEVARAREMAAEVNRSRIWLYDFQLSRARQQGTATATTEDEIRRQYYNRVRSGEWIEDERGRWVRVN